MRWYAQALANAFGSTSSGNAPNIDYLTDDIRFALVTSSYSPSLATDDFWNDVVANEVSGTGYTAGGIAVASRTLTITAANSWANAWTASTAYTARYIVRPTTGNGNLYMAQAAGTSAASEPTWPTTLGDEVADSGVTWTNVGTSIGVFDFADPSWPSSTITARYGVLYNRTPATDATRPLIGLSDFGSNIASTGGTFTVTINAQGALLLLIG
jgi:hypothetical protein